MITNSDFSKIDIRVGTIIEVRHNELSNNSSLILIINFGENIGLKKTSAQLISNYTIESLVNMQVAAVINLPSKQIGKMLSEVLILGFPDNNNNPVLVMPASKIPNGGKLF
jgi:tRNA-binding protein